MIEKYSLRKRLDKVQDVGAAARVLDLFLPDLDHRLDSSKQNVETYGPSVQSLSLRLYDDENRHR